MVMGVWIWLWFSVICSLAKAEVRVEVNPQIPFMDGQLVELKATWTGSRDLCQWYSNESLLCSISQGQGQIQCGADYKIKASFSSPSTCSLKFQPFEVAFNGYYKVGVSKGSEIPEKSEIIPLCAEQDPKVQIEIASQFPDIIEVDQNKAVSIDCYARGGRPEPDKFQWLLENSEDFLQQSEYEASLSPLGFVSVEDNYGFRDVYQTLTITFPEAIDYRLECVASGDFNFRDEVAIFVREDTSRALTGGAIAGIVLAVLIILLIIAFLVFIFLTKKLCFSGDKNKQSQDPCADRTRSNVRAQPQPQSHTQVGTKPKATPAPKNYVVGEDFQRSAPTPGESEAWNGNFLSLHIPNPSSSNDSKNDTFRSASLYFPVNSEGQNNPAFQPTESGQSRGLPSANIGYPAQSRPKKQLIDDGRGYLV